MKPQVVKWLFAMSLGCLAFLVLTSSTLAGTLSAAYEVIRSNTIVDLTTQGPVDWVHWGFASAASVDRKASVPPRIENLTPILVGGGDGPTRFDDNFNGYSWTDGAPTKSATNSPTGLYITGKKCGFRLTVPAATTSRTLKVYVGAFAAKGQFDASLSDNSAPAYSDTSLENVSNGPSGVYTVHFAAGSTGQVLTVTWTVNAQYDHDYANVTLHAAALANGPSAESAPKDPAAETKPAAPSPKGP